jgi:hypothetical protein
MLPVAASGTSVAHVLGVGILFAANCVKVWLKNGYKLLVVILCAYCVLFVFELMRLCAVFALSVLHRGVCLGGVCLCYSGECLCTALAALRRGVCYGVQSPGRCANRLVDMVVQLLCAAVDGSTQCLLAAFHGIPRSLEKPGVCVLVLYCVLAQVLAYALNRYALDVAVW